LGLGNDDRAAGLREPARVLLLVPARRELAGDEHRGQTGRGELPDGAAGAGEHDVRGAVREPDLLDERAEEVVGAAHAAAQLRVVALAAEVDDGRAGLRPRVERDVVQEPGAERAAEDEDDPRVLRQAELTARLAPVAPKRRGRDWPPDGA